ncbi:dynactin-like protein Arp1 p62 subunit RO2 [Lophiostoma macrostomum CBS 122681]|uniref:Dynactin subunit 4 n=1 Tax=Lophiostoma macrostomum CBS 122681 TaxID=1314788 RepID=A0A6A6SZP1_9PLEO|nr:dynactin-like protein Arp1 p62 subunit RO2 [Lophiostoma macrostomum CBS 122681]
MAQPFPYTYYSCDCCDSDATAPRAERTSQLPPADDEDARTFDPRSPRANYSLYPLEHLLYCEDCQQIRCPRCVIEETLNWYCPSCLFEVPSSVIKTDGNRCTRNCYNCPVCTSPMTVNSLEDPAKPSPSGGPFILSCPYCHWSTVEIGITLEKHTGITSQLARTANGGKYIPSQKERDKERERRLQLSHRKSRDVLSGSDDSPTVDIDTDPSSMSHEDIFSNLSAFYKSQIAAQTPSYPFSPGHDINFSSPVAYSRLMTIYSPTTSKKRWQEKPAVMRESSGPLEGLIEHDSAADNLAIERLKKEGWASTLTPSQKLAQVSKPDTRFDDSLRPIPALLCTKRGKRCRDCRHILSKPESKITSTRYKIKLVAFNHIPRLSIRALASSPSSTSTTPAPTPTTPSTSTSTSTQAFNYNALKPGIPIPFLLHLLNPLFDPIRVTLATPKFTSGRVQSQVTILCPQFEVGANTDVWDDALTGSALGSVKKGGGPSGGAGGGGGSGGGGELEAGKIWEKGRNWTTVVVEVVPGFLRGIPGFGGSGRSPAATTSHGHGTGNDDDAEELEDAEDEHDAVLEIPVFVRIEYETDAQAEDRSLVDPRGGKGEKVKREEAFWTVVGVGRIQDV